MYNSLFAKKMYRGNIAQIMMILKNESMKIYSFSVGYVLVKVAGCLGNGEEEERGLRKGAREDRDREKRDKRELS